jgi:hypothetical protein
MWRSIFVPAMKALHILSRHGHITRSFGRSDRSFGKWDAAPDYQKKEGFFNARS